MGTASAENERLTATELWDRVGELGDVELIDGRVVAMPPTGIPHGRAEVRLGRFLDEWAEDRGAIVAVGEVGYAIDEHNVRGADVAVHLEPPPEGGGWSRVAPDVVVEVVSPNDRWTEIETKARLWLDFGVREVWIADPSTCRVQVRTRTGSTRLLERADTLSSDALPGFELALDRVFS